MFTNKYILSDISFHNCQVAFAAYHFFITGATLWVVSRPQCAIFIPKQVSIMQISPLAAAMCIQVVLQNLSLAYSSFMFHQLARLLLTPVVALLNYMLYSTKIPRAAVSPLILLCSGVGIVSYYDSLAMDSASAASTSSRGTIFALAGVCTSAVHTVWIGQYHKKFQLNSMQLLLNQAPVSTVLLLLTVHFTATPPLAAVPVSMWVLILMVWRCIHVLSSALLTSTERPLCFFGESLAVFHHPLGGTHQRDGGRPAQDVHHCRAGMGFQHASHLFSEHCRDYAGVGGHELVSHLQLCEEHNANGAQIYAGHDASAEVIH